MRKMTILTVTFVVALTFVSCSKGEGGSLKTTETDSPLTTTAVGDTTDNSRRGRVDVFEMNFRTGPSTDMARVKGREVLYWGTEFDIIDEEGEWVQVKLDDGTVGWLRATYEGKTYIQDSAEPTGILIPGRRPMDSNEFLAFAQKEATKWDEDAQLSLFCGSGGGLDGKCYSWTAIYKSPSKPGKKLMCGNQGEDFAGGSSTGSGLIANEWNEDWVLPNRTDSYGMAPGPTWVNYEDFPAPGDFISSSALCSKTNINDIVKRDYEKRPRGINGVSDFREFVETSGELDFVLNGDKWEIRLGGAMGGSMVYRYDAGTGGFISCTDETF